MSEHCLVKVYILVQNLWISVQKYEKEIKFYEPESDEKI